VAALANFYKILPEQILVAHDELDFAEGIARLKKGGGDGRHNGLKSIIASLGNNQFLRLRIGIGHPGHSDKVSGHVLGVPTREQHAAIQIALDKSIDILPLLLAGDLHAATQRLHTA
jgi:PTH1 family peptidyl-tRNA hydrolase